MEVSTSFLSNNNYTDMITMLNESKTDYIHFDVMDGKFVKNKNLGKSELGKLLDLSKKKNDIHLMVEDPSSYIEMLSLYDVSYVTVHSEIKDYEKYLDMIKSYGIRCGVSVNPDTDVTTIFDILEKVDLVLIMSVVPGASGQSFRYDVLPKIKVLKEEIEKRGLSLKIEIDGGINDEVLSSLKDIDIVVSASYILKDLSNIEKIKSL